MVTVVEVIGTIGSASIIFDQCSGKSKGFGFVEMPNYEEAIKAVVELDRKELWNRPLKVCFACSRIRSTTPAGKPSSVVSVLNLLPS